MTKQHRISVKYSISFKQKVVQEIEQDGLTFSAARRRYGIKGGNTIQQWVINFGKNHLLNKIVRVEMKGEKDRVKDLETEIKRLKMALADATLENKVLETIIDMVNENYDTDVKKNFGQEQSKNLTKGKEFRK